MKLRKIRHLVQIATIATTLLLPLSPGTPAEAAIPMRGIVEGFYGTPWSHADRLEMLHFSKEKKFNAYIYAPKDDPYHRAKWREPYPEDKLEELKALIQQAQREKVKFIFAISPGLDIQFEGLAGISDRLAMKEKMEAMYALGVRNFAIFFDDIENKDARSQAEFLNWLETNFIERHQGLAPLITVPTEYFRQDMEEKGLIKPYTKVFSKLLYKDIMVLYTGEKVVPDGLTDEEYDSACRLYHRKLGLWWNYPVSDYLETKLALGPVEKLPRRKKLPALFFNPMKYPQLSKLSLATGAAYARSPRGYKSEKAWQRSLKEQYGKLAKDMEAFAGHSQHMLVSWAEIGPADGAKLRQLADAYWAANNSKEKKEASKKLCTEPDSLEGSLNRLLAGLSPELLSTCRPQLEQLLRISQANQLGIELLEGNTNRQADFERLLQEVKEHDKEALVSGKSARALLTEIETALSAR